MREVNIEISWKDRLASEFAADYMAALSQFLRAEKAAGRTRSQTGKKIVADLRQFVPPVFVVFFAFIPKHILKSFSFFGTLHRTCAQLFDRPV